MPNKKNIAIRFFNFLVLEIAASLEVLASHPEVAMEHQFAWLEETFKVRSLRQLVKTKQDQYNATIKELEAKNSEAIKALRKSDRPDTEKVDEIEKLNSEYKENTKVEYIKYKNDLSDFLAQPSNIKFAVIPSSHLPAKDLSKEVYLTVGDSSMKTTYKGIITTLFTNDLIEVKRE